MICFGVGWYADREKMRAQIALDKIKAQSSADGMIWLILSDHAHFFSQQIGKSPQKIEDFNRRNLALNLIMLCEHEADVDDRTRSTTRETAATRAGDLLSELACKSYDEFLTNIPDHLKRAFPFYLDPESDKHGKLKSFIERSLQPN